ncbi:MAG TPA: hypothetical protein VMY05_12285 [Acidobacteriota bacterium]|nr:hypothetical protein [Acidobacteriota bacterium]
MMVSQREPLGQLSESFVARAGIELKRAERYRVFVALSVLDMEFTKEFFTEVEYAPVMDGILGVARNSVRACDYVSLVGPHHVCLLFPETSRQGAEVALRRIGDSIREELARRTDKTIDQVIPVELSSYPDAAGARTVEDFLEELQHRARN